MQELSKQKIIEDLLDHYYEKRLEPLRDTDQYCFNVNGDIEKNIVDDSPCILLLNSFSSMKIYTGPMLWNKIDTASPVINETDTTIVDLFRSGRGCNESTSWRIEDEMCWRMVSDREYFVLCCCWTNPFNCSYAPNMRELTERRKKLWPKFIKKSIETGVAEEVFEPRYYCARVAFSATSLENLNFSMNDWTISIVADLPSRYRFCLLRTTVFFKNNELTNITHEAEPDEEEFCELSKCHYTDPGCLNQLLVAETVMIRIVCCCTGNLCIDRKKRRTGNVNPDIMYRKIKSCTNKVLAYLRFGSLAPQQCVRTFDLRYQRESYVHKEHQLVRYKYHEIKDYDARDMTCAIYQAHIITDPYCNLGKNFDERRIPLQYYKCSCNSTIKGETMETPICVTDLIISRFGVFYRFAPMRYSDFQDESGTKKRFTITKGKYYSTYTVMCRTNETMPCNNGNDLAEHLLIYAMHVHSRIQIPELYHQCSRLGNVTAGSEQCSTSAGCYFFKYQNRDKKLAGCVDEIPMIVKASPDLSPLAWCFEITNQMEKYKCRAFKGTTSSIASGILCCCQKDCIMMSVLLDFFQLILKISRNTASLFQNFKKTVEED
uniref:Uncharacterized protein n=1 Tax=Setaria digitata TaxID=48799 RepID=A0A915PN77_9BILA